MVAKKKYQKINEITGVGRNAEQTELLKRVFDGLELRDAKASIMLIVKEEDIDQAIRGDLEKCVFAKACHRQFDSGKCVFTAGVAYVEMEDEEGVNRVLRFMQSSKMTQAVKLWDVEGKAFAGTYYMMAPSPSNTLEARLKKGRKRRSNPKVKTKEKKAARKRHALMTILGRTKATRHSTGPLGILRKGTGLIHTNVVEV